MKKILVVLFVLALSISSQANIISYSDSITGLFDLVETRDLLIPQFDSSLGTLNSVTVNFSTAIQGSVGFENLKRFAGGNFAITVNTHGMVVLDYAVISNFLDQQTYNTTLGAYDGTLDYAGTSGTILATYSDADTMQYTLTSDFTRFLGNSNVIFPILAESVADSISKPSNSSSELNTTGQASVTVTYDFTPVPEPATIAVLALGGLLFKRKRV
ncbi:MAG: PEP-CTERM sorting domain-containing protein [Phycisphaerales bacterium]